MKWRKKFAYQWTDCDENLEKGNGFSFQACLFALASAVVISVLVPYLDLTIPQAWLGITALPIASFGCLFALVTFVNPILRLIGYPLNQQELLTCFTAAMVSSGIASLGLTGLLLQYLVGLHYYATAENRWGEVLLPHIPRWLYPESGEVVRYFYEGLPKGVSVLPFLLKWVRPLAACLPLIIGVYAVFFALTNLLWRQWVEKEKLVFPLVTLPVELTRYESPADWFPSLFRNKAMWVGFAIPFVIHTVNGLHTYFPQIPFINVQRRNLDPYLPGRPWDAVAPFWIALPFSVVGFSYFLPTEVTSSIIVFYGFFLAQQVVASALGKPMQNVQAYPVKDFVAHQMFGGIFVFSLYLLWNARQSFRPAPPNRQSYLMLSLGIALIGAWGYFSRASVILPILLFGLFFLTHIVAVRLVCEAGLLLVQHPLRPWTFLLTLLGSKRLTSRQIVLLTFFDHLFMLDNRAPLMPCLMQAMKISNAASIPACALINLMAFSVIIALIVSATSFLWTAYRRGGVNLHPWFTTYFARDLFGNWTAFLLTFGLPPSPIALLRMVVGAASMSALLFIHRTFPSFPLHPVGYLTGVSFPTIAFWFPISLGWFLKATTVKFGGIGLYRRLLPGFLGLIMAEYLSANLWTVINTLTGRPGPEIFVF